MKLSDFENEIKLKHSNWKLHKSQSGVATWIDIMIPNQVGFTIQVTPDNGIGVSRRSGEALEFGGHDEVYNDLDCVLHYLESQEL